jgi:hypothetical protein
MSGLQRLQFRAVLYALGGIQLLNGVWITISPASFYEDFPLGRGWVAALPAYNEHLMRDVGALFAATGTVLIVAGVWMEARVIALALVSYLIFSVPHTIYHVFNLEPYGTGDAVANVVALVATVVLPIYLLIVLTRLSRRPGRPPPAP